VLQARFLLFDPNKPPTQNEQSREYSRLLPLVLVSPLFSLFGTVLSGTPAFAQEQPQCLIQNQASYSYSDSVNPDPINGVSNAVLHGLIGTGEADIAAGGVRDGDDSLAVGVFAGTLADELVKLGFTQTEATEAVIAAIVAMSQQPANATFSQLARATRDAVIEAVPTRRTLIEGLDRAAAQEIGTVIFTNLFRSQLIRAGLTEAEAETTTQAAVASIRSADGGTSANDAFDAAFQAMIGALPEQAELLTELRDDFIDEINAIRNGVRSDLRQGNVLRFEFVVTNNGNTSLRYQLPDANTIQQTGIVGPGVVTGVQYNVIQADQNVLLTTCPTPTPTPTPEPTPTPTPEPTPTPTPGPTPTPTPTPGPTPTPTPTPGPTPTPTPTPGPTPTPTPIPVPTPTPVVIPPGGGVVVVVDVDINPVPRTGTSVTVVIGDPDKPVPQTVVIPPVVVRQPLTSPLGRITDCAGGLLPDYEGFSVALYEADPGDPTGGIGSLVDLTETEYPDVADNDIKEGSSPNTQNSNPFYLTNGDQGGYNFLLDLERGQLEAGDRYILVINPPPGSNYNQRRIRIDIVSNNNGVITYTATSLDGRPISANAGSNSATGQLDLNDPERRRLDLAVLDLTAAICEARELQIIKTGDRFAAEPGDTVIYRLSVRNLSATSIDTLNITDQLPLGFSFRSDSVRAELNGQAVPITATNQGRSITLNLNNFTLPAREVLNIAYAARLTPDSLRGDGRNSAIVNGLRTDNDLPIKDGPAIHKLAIRPGIVSDCGTLIGRVFVDKNFDGEQQPGEPGMPNAVVFMDDGNRITTDANGLFSVANVLPGYRTGVLDLTSVPGYTFAPNNYFSERNSQSRLVRIEPGGLARMNFAVTPAFQEEGRTVPLGLEKSSKSLFPWVKFPKFGNFIAPLGGQSAFINEFSSTNIWGQPTPTHSSAFTKIGVKQQGGK
jgi:uncharacterized repeat protein (TIGR01451 family)